MSMKTTDHLLAKPRSDAATAIAFAVANKATRLNDVKTYIAEVYRLAPLVGIDPAIIIAQSIHETDIWQSFWWQDRLNPAGLGITGDPTENEQSRIWLSGTTAARAQIAHMLLYATGKIDKGGLKPAEDPRYDAYIDKFGNTVQAVTINDLTGKWGVDTQYAPKLVSRGNVAFPGLPDQAGTDPVDTGTGRYKREEIYILVDAGHRSTDRSGNPAEMDRTDDMAEAYVAACLAAGFKAEYVKWFQRDLDGDGQPRDTVGNLNTVALGAATQIRKVIAKNPDVKLILFVSCHFNGANSPWHVIVANNVGLRTAYVGGAPADDIAANNSLDVAFAKALVQKQIKAVGGYAVYNGSIGAGIMGEDKTGVGLDGYRLALTAATAASLIRMKSIRIIVEHGGTAAAVAQRRPWFEQTCATAFASTIVDVLVDTDVITPTPPTPPKPVVTKPAKPFLFRIVNGETLAPLGSGGKGLPVRFAVPTKTRVSPSPSAAVVSTIKANAGATAAYSLVGDDEQLWVWLSSGSYVPASSFVGVQPRIKAASNQFEIAHADAKKLAADTGADVDPFNNLDLVNPVDAAGRPLNARIRAATADGDDCSTVIDEADIIPAETV